MSAQITLDLDALVAAARAAGGEVWTSDPAGKDGRGDVIWGADGDGVAIAYHCIGHQPETLSAEDIAAHIAAANPAVVLALIKRLRAAEADHAAARLLLVEQFAHDHEALADLRILGLADRIPVDALDLSERIGTFLAGGAA